MVDKINGLLKSDVSPPERDGHAQDKDAKNVNSRSAIGATEDDVVRRPVRSGGRDFAFQQPLRSPADLLAMADKAKEGLDLRSGAKEVKVTVHMGTCGIAAGARDVVVSFISEIADAKLDNVTIHQSGCAGLCEMEPMATVQFAEGGVYRYGHLEGRGKVHEIVQSHLVGGTPVSAYLIQQK